MTQITYDARGLAEPFAEVPKISEIDGETARFDAKDLTGHKALSDFGSSQLAAISSIGRPIKARSMRSWPSE